MALRARSEQEWEEFFVSANIPEDSAKEYANCFQTNGMTEDVLFDITKQDLKDLGITAVGHILLILRKSKQLTQADSNDTSPSSTTPVPPARTEEQQKSKPPPPKLPQLTLNMTHPQYRKFHIDWKVFKSITSISTVQIPSMIYSACDEATQNSIINSVPNFFELEEQDIWKSLEPIVTQHSNPTIHRMSFCNISQREHESIQDYVVRLNSAAVDCEYACPSCKTDISSMHIKDQFIRGLFNQQLQTDILAKTNHLKTLTEIIHYSETFEAAIKDQRKLASESSVAHISERISHSRRTTKANSVKQYKPCRGCGSNEHGSWERSRKCPAWGKRCTKCQIMNHDAEVCRQTIARSETIQSLMAHVSGISRNPNEHIQEITATLTAIRPRQAKPATMQIYPDSGASICVAGPQHLKTLNINRLDLLRCRTKITTVGGFRLYCIGYVVVKFEIGENSTTQPLYICEKVDRIYFSRTGCVDTNILSTAFPHPTTSEAVRSIQSTAPVMNHSQSNNDRQEEPVKVPPRPDCLPYPPTEDNVIKLKEFLLNKFADTAFNRSIPFPVMSGPEAHIHLQSSVTPHAKHSPIPVPYHLKEEIKKSLDNDVARGIITPVPIGSPVEWCSTMVVIPKKNGSYRRTVDLQHLNSQCLRETHHCQSPFQLACQVPANTKKTILDAVDGYHAVALDKESQPLTTFITEWGRYMYLRMPQGFLASGDAYTRRYDEIIKDTPRKVKCIDDTLLYDEGIEQAFFHTWDYLTLCANNGIVLNKEKFQFCLDTVTFAGLKLTPNGIVPSDDILSAIKDFPPPKDLTGARSWMGLVNQTAWAYSISEIMLPFRELIKSKSKFEWNDSLQRSFEHSKAKLISAVEEGIQTFNTQLPTCIQCDWSKEGIGYLLLQKHCQCNMNDAPNCCTDGWKLVYAGSRFTTATEGRYAPTEGEALSVAWSLNHARMFVLGCPNLLIVTDHKPLLGILGDRDISTIDNPRIQRLKSKTLRYRFQIKHCPGKWHKGADALSRYPSPVISSIMATTYASCEDDCDADQCEDLLNCITINAIHALNPNDDSTEQAITIQRIERAASSDETYQTLLENVRTGFPKSRNDANPLIRKFWEVRKRLSAFGNIILLDKRIVIPVRLQRAVLHILHSAHQGCTGMKLRANATIYWPGMNSSILNFRADCHTCTAHAPSQPKEPLIATPPPQWPFQKICADYFEVNGQTYLVIVDRFSGWICIYHYKQAADSNSLVDTCRTLFAAYGTPEEFSSDGGPQFISGQFKKFLSTWGITHRLSSAEYPQSNGRAELGVKAAKRIIYGNVTRSGSIDTDKAARAIMQYRNTPLPDIKLSPAQILFHRQMRDHLPAHPTHYKLHKKWFELSQKREQMISERNMLIETKYDSNAHPLAPLPVGTAVVVQNKGKKRYNCWDRSGRIVEALPHRQYKVVMDGSGRVTLRNRRFIRQDHSRKSFIAPSPFTFNEVSKSPENPSYSNTETAYLEPPNITTASTSTPSRICLETPSSIPPTGRRDQGGRIPQALKNLQDFNKPGLKEQMPLLPRR